jgi:hypothetical protein
MTDLDPVTFGIPVRIVGTDHIVKTHIVHDGGAVQPLATFVAGTIIEDIVVVITEAFNGTATIDIGDVDPDSLLPNAGISKSPLMAVSGEDESTRGVYLYSTHGRCKYLAAGTTFNASLGSLGTTTTGEADVLITYKGP